MGATRLAFFDDFDALQQTVLASSGGAGSVLVKGSRFMRMERVVQALQDAAAQGSKTC
jgi:UDP-N-acetylmuramoyl-tripeptide--D-alanyl-D-alanine ligase